MHAAVKERRLTDVSPSMLMMELVARGRVNMYRYTGRRQSITSGKIACGREVDAIASSSRRLGSGKLESRYASATE